MPLQIDKIIKNKIEETDPQFSTSIDNYLKWVPLYSVFVLDAFGVQTKNDLKKQIKLVVASETIQSIVTNPLKKMVKEVRPGASLHHNSFPSGHAATSFAGAEILRIEMKDCHPMLCYGGYAVATATGILRLYNNRHWFSDVVAGALIGILSARLAYRIFSGKNRRRTRFDNDDKDGKQASC
jgi:membrane-associated phospholipid phosphatase